MFDPKLKSFDELIRKCYPQPTIMSLVSRPFWFGVDRNAEIKKKNLTTNWRKRFV